MPMTRNRKLALLMFLGLAAVTLAAVFQKTDGNAPGEQASQKRAAPVEITPVMRGSIELTRTFSGTLEAAEMFMVAPKVTGRIARLDVDLGDTVERGQVVARLDDEEHAQAVREMQAELAVTKATLTEAERALEITTREHQRVSRLFASGAMSESELDEAEANLLAREAQLQVARARVTKAEAMLAAAKIRLGYTDVTAGWSTGDSSRVVAERMVDEGEIVSENTPLLSIVEIDPIIGVLLVTEKEYSRMTTRQTVSMETDAHPGMTFTGRVSRIAPVFQQSTRQARVEVSVPNEGGLLKPGMFIRATVVMGRKDNAALVPEQALTRRDGKDGLFVLNQDAAKVAWREVRTGISQGGLVEIVSPDLSGNVVTIGQQFLEDGSAVEVISTAGESAANSES